MKALITLLFLGLLVGFLFIWFGLFNISAKDKHWDVTTELLELVRDRSIEVRSKNIQVPDLSNPEMIANGAKNFDAMCSQCHLAPGMEPTELNLGLYPQPPVFYNEKHDDHDHSAANTFWVIANGLKMTGMPAWGDFHTDEQLWEMVAFMNTINGMSESEYKALVGEGGHTHKPGFGHGDHGEEASSMSHDTLHSGDISNTNNHADGHNDGHGDHDH